jgi:hypothetical protein
MPWKLSFTASGEGVTDRFGEKVAINGNYLAVGSALNNEGPGNDAGKVYLYEKRSNGWKLVFTALGEAAVDFFTRGLSISGDYLAIGASGNNEVDDDTGKVYLYEKRYDGWKLVFTALGGSDGTDDEKLGSSVSIYDRYLLVGSPGNSPGKISLYCRESDGWKLKFSKFGD